MTNPQLPPVAEAAHLTAALRKAGALDRGAVREVTVLSSRDTILSHIVRLGVRYVGESDGAPQSLILKIAQATFAKTLPRLRGVFGVKAPQAKLSSRGARSADP
jgi:hypothetical protein